MDGIKKREMILIVITVILVIILGIGFYYDRNSALLDRTNALAVSQDPNLKAREDEQGRIPFREAVL